MILLNLLGLASVLGLLGLCLTLWRTLKRAPKVSACPGGKVGRSVSVIIPAYNEEANIIPCLRSVLESASESGERVEVVVVDDGSTDHTRALLSAWQRENPQAPLRLVFGEDPLPGQVWVRKNWACHQGSRVATGDYLLFVDADVRLDRGALLAALATADREQLGLLTLAPRLDCGCWAEWLVQPTMAAFIGLRFDFDSVNDPRSRRAFACGPFMLFRRDVYEAVGGHRAVASEIVEDVMLARRVKETGHRLKLAMGTSLVSLRMYPNGRALWEGWTKSIYFAMEKSALLTLLSSAAMLVLFALPWALLPVGLALRSPPLALAAVAGVALQWALRRVCARYLALPATAWWMTGAGGAAIALMAVVSMIKWETGWGWTWRGRALRPS